MFSVGFQSGWIFLDDDNRRSDLNSVSGSLPKGKLDQVSTLAVLFKCIPSSAGLSDSVRAETETQHDRS